MPFTQAAQVDPEVRELRPPCRRHGGYSV